MTINGTSEEPTDELFDHDQVLRARVQHFWVVDKGFFFNPDTLQTIDSTNVIGSRGLKKEIHDFFTTVKMEIAQQKNPNYCFFNVIFVDHRSTNMIRSRKKSCFNFFTQIFKLEIVQQSNKKNE